MTRRERKARRNEERRQAAARLAALPAPAEAGPPDAIAGLQARIEGRRMARVAAVGMVVNT